MGGVSGASVFSVIGTGQALPCAFRCLLSSSVVAVIDINILAVDETETELALMV